MTLTKKYHDMTPDQQRDFIADVTDLFEEVNQVPCSKCGQINQGQTGEYPCEVCGLPTMHDEPCCDYYGCHKPLAPDQAETGMKFCVEHDVRFTEIAKRIEAGGDAMELFAFWIEAQGGAYYAASGL